MTARCAQYMSALKIVRLCNRKISRLLLKNLHIDRLSDRIYYRYHEYFKSKIPVYGPLRLTSHTASILETTRRHSFPQSFLRACAVQSAVHACSSAKQAINNLYRSLGVPQQRESVYVTSTLNTFLR